MSARRTAITIVSPHADDAVFSLGGWIARTARGGQAVRVVTVFGNDPTSSAPPSEWDAACGFGTEGEAAAARRAEDARACDLVGAAPIWFNFRDDDHGRTATRDEVWEALSETLTDGGTVLCPGFPLLHPDHIWLTELAVDRIGGAQRLGFYVEQPYACWRLIGRGRRSWAVAGLTARQGIRNLLAILARTPRARRLQQPVLPDELAAAVAGQPRWRRARVGALDRVTKQRAMRAYSSQLEGFGPLVASRIAIYEAGWGGEGLATVD